MVTIRYNLTPEDLAELEALRRGGLLFRILRIPVAAFVGLMGLAMAWPAIFVFPWHPWGHWFGNLAIAAVGLFILWMGLDAPGLRWLFARLSDPCAESELQIYEGGIVSSCRGKTRYLRLRPRRSFRENGKFFFLRALDTELAIPKHAVTPDQEERLRELLQPEVPQQEPTRGNAIECSFFLTQDELNEASASRHRSFLERWLATKHGKALGRAFLGLSALGILGLPALMGKSWALEFNNEPGIAIGLVALGLFYLFTAAGCPGLKALNRLDLQRRMRISDAGAEVTRGSKSSTYQWNRLLSYHETQNLFVLRTQVAVRFWTIPKRALQTRDEETLRALLDRKLPRQ